MGRLVAIKFAILLLVSTTACNDEKMQEPLFQLMESTGIDFENKIEDGEFDNSFLFRNFYNGGGVAIADINNDKLADVFLTSNMGENKLYLNKGNFVFEDISIKAGLTQDSMWSTGVTLVDINADGWLDVYVCNSGHMKTGRRKNKLYINNRNLTFTESAKQYGLDVSAYTTQVSFFDYDLDGDLDCFMINNSPMPINTLNNAGRRDLPDAKWPVPDFLKGGGDHLYRNDNDFFVDVTSESGIHGSLISFGLGVSVADLNDDGYLDIYVGNDSFEKDYLYINQKNGKFVDELEQRVQSISMSSMGTDVGDLNNDGFPEIFTTDMLPKDDYRLKTLGSFDNIDFYNAKVKSGFYHQFMKNCLQLNNKNGTFSEIGNYTGISATDWSWGELLFDADNDGLTDIYVCNGVNKDVTNLDFMDFFANEVIQKMVLTGKKDNVEEVLQHIPVYALPNNAFKNKGNLQFEDVSSPWGFTQPSFSNGAAYGDLDNDGDLDLVVNNVNQKTFIYKNSSRENNSNNFVGIFLKGNDKNTYAIGSKILLYADNQILSRENIPSRGFQSSVDYKQIIGLGGITKVDSIIVIWPDQTYSKFSNPQVNKILDIREPVTGSKVKYVKTPLPKPGIFTSVANNFEKHKEDEYQDFYYERNLPEILSKQGPKAAVGDLNGDLLDDIYIGGAAGQGGQLYFQKNAGDFFKSDQKIFNDYADFEDEDVLLFDSDNDSDLDLLVCPGGNKFPANSKQIQLRLYKNDGRGNFSLDPKSFPANNGNISVAVAHDFNADGYPDLFVGGGSVSKDYGLSPLSYIYINDRNGHFKELPQQTNMELGMVTDAAWADIIGDSNKELIVVGKWMHPTVFTYSNNQFSEIKTDLENLYGWWQTVSVVDINADGKQDIILGNIGENFFLKPDKNFPVKLWINDFNQNGTIDKIVTRTIEGKDKPVFLKREMQDQIPSIKKQNLKHQDFAKKSMSELFSPEVCKKCQVKIFNYPSSVAVVNKANGKFEVNKLPVMAQMSVINAIHLSDLNKDGFPDLILGGNQWGFPPQFGRLDASYGDVLINDGKGNFKWIDAIQSGLKVTGVVRDIKELKTARGKHLLFLRNNDFPELYKFNNN